VAGIVSSAGVGVAGSSTGIGIGSSAGIAGASVSAGGATGFSLVCGAAGTSAGNTSVQQLATGAQVTTGTQHTGCGWQHLLRHKRQAKAELTAIVKTTNATTKDFA
jgi:hypothetical protein